MLDPYDALLSRAKANIPVPEVHHERFKLPILDIVLEGKTTIFKNFGDVVEILRRSKEDMLTYLLKELGTSGYIDGRRVIFKGRILRESIDEKLQNYLSMFVLCSECKRPDTKLVKENRTLMLECEACGARRPVSVGHKTTAQEIDSSLEEGKVYEFIIQDVGKKGDGVAKKDKYIIFIPGTSKGQTVMAKITKITGNICFGTVI